MSVKEYQLAKTRQAMAKRNELVEAKSRYYSSNDLFYDFSLLDTIKWDGEIKEIVENDLMEHHAVSWYQRPMPTIIIYDRFTHFVGQVETAVHRVFKADGKRMMVIIEVTGFHIERQRRSNVYQKYLETDRVYEANSHNVGYDIDFYEIERREATA